MSLRNVVRGFVPKPAVCFPFGALVVALTLLVPGFAQAQGYPDRPVRVIVPFAAGGGSDVIGRAIAQKLQDKLGQPFIVENRTGAGGSLGAVQVARAAPDGYTLLLGSSSEISQYPTLKKDIGYDPVKDFLPIAAVATVPLALAVRQELPVKSVAELIDYARKNPGKLNYGSAGPGSTTHLAVALFTSMTGTDMVHVPYKGSAPVVTDLLAGTLDLSISTMPAVLPHANGGKLRILAVSTASRSKSLPDAITIAEGGVKGYETGLWTGLLAPAGTPKEVVAQLNTAVNEALASEDLKALLAKQGAEPTGGTEQSFADTIHRDLSIWTDLVKKTGIKIE
ncbi:MAG: tripartite tricarboxylate transporter substrate binding protein [Pseudorhodoplanes sp.]